MFKNFEIDVPARADEEVEKQETTFFLSLPIDSDTEKRVKDILGEYFDLFKDFFDEKLFNCEKAEDKKATATFLVTRRCFLIANWFLQYHLVKKKGYKLEIRNNCLCLVNNEKDYANYILSDKGIFSFYVNVDIKKKIGKCVILDDIVIHGENLNRIKEELVETLREAGAEIETYKETCIESESSIISSVNSSSKKSINGEWIIPSRRIVDVISYLNLPYVSYLNSYTNRNLDNYESDQMVEKLDNDNELIIFNFGEDRREILGKMSFFIAERSHELKSYEKTKFVRYYYNYKTNVACFVPFVQLKKLNRRVTFKVLNEYLENDAYKELTEELTRYEEICHKKEILIKQYDKYIGMLLNCVASNYYGYYFINKYMENEKIDIWSKDSIRCLLMTFGKRIYNIITEKKNYKFSQDNDSSNIKSVKNRINEDEEVLHQLKNELDDETNEFCALRWANCEFTAFRRERKPLKENLDIISTQTLSSKVRKEVAELLRLCSIVDFCDQGRLAISIDENNLENVVEVGELGVMSARTSQNDKVRDILQKLLIKDYYKYLLV